MLDLDLTRTPVTPRLAATLIVLRACLNNNFEVCVMQRSAQSSFLNGAVVFPGGGVEASDSVERWPSELYQKNDGIGWDEIGLSSRIAAIRETFEEVGIPLFEGEALSPEQIREFRNQLNHENFAKRLNHYRQCLKLTELIPYSYWVTPEAEKRRYATRFFLTSAPVLQEIQIDANEAQRAFWATPSQLLEQYSLGQIALVPPTHRTLEELSRFSRIEDVFEEAQHRTHQLEMVLPRYVVEDENKYLVLPGDPLHEVQQQRTVGSTRYVSKDGRWFPAQ